MTILSIYSETGQASGPAIKDFAQIKDILGEHGVTLERWETNQPLADDAGQDEVLAAYDESIQKLNAIYGFESLDVVALRPDNPNKEEFRKKFLDEHTHADFEIRFFVDGSGVFYLHINDKVYLVLCEKGDLISVPANTTHWFDMGANPNFKCIRLFTTKDGWVGDFTGSDIAKRFPCMDSYVAIVS